jgi:hypothetical protein
MPPTLPASLVAKGAEIKLFEYQTTPCLAREAIF